MKQSIEPGWLVQLMTRWARRSLRAETHAIGYPSKSPGFSEKTTGGYNHSEPFDFTGEDYRQLDEVLNRLSIEKQLQYITMMMYYKPWTVRAMVDEGVAFGNSTYYQRLHSAHGYVATELIAMRDHVE